MKLTRVRIFSRRTPSKVGINLKLPFRCPARSDWKNWNKRFSAELSSYSSRAFLFLSNWAKTQGKNLLVPCQATYHPTLRFSGRRVDCFSVFELKTLGHLWYVDIEACKEICSDFLFRTSGDRRNLLLFLNFFWDEVFDEPIRYTMEHWRCRRRCPEEMSRRNSIILFSPVLTRAIHPPRLISKPSKPKRSLTV